MHTLVHVQTYVCMLVHFPTVAHIEKEVHCICVSVTVPCGSL